MLRLSVKLLCRLNAILTKGETRREKEVQKMHISYKTIKLYWISLSHQFSLQRCCSWLSIPKMVWVALPIPWALLRILLFPLDEVESDSPPTEFGQKYGGREPMWLLSLDFKQWKSFFLPFVCETTALGPLGPYVKSPRPPHCEEDQATCEVYLAYRSYI